MPDPTSEDHVNALEKAFTDTVRRWGRAAQTFQPASAAPNPASWIARIVKTMLKLAAKLFGFVRQIVTEGPPALAALLGDLAETLVEEAGGLLEDLADLTGQALETGLGAVLGFIELVKKSIYLVTDFIDKRFPGNDLTAIVRLHLDLIDNLLGQIADLVSPRTGKAARRLRRDMYEQLAAIRVAEGVAPRVPPDTDGDRPE
jgi:hypothetical protein